MTSPKNFVGYPTFISLFGWFGKSKKEKAGEYCAGAVTESRSMIDPV